MLQDENRLAIAEQYLDEMIQAEAANDYELFTKRFDPDTLKDFGPSRFKKEMLCINEDLGKYQSRIYMGALKGFVDVDDPHKHPNCIRYNWRGIFEKNETLITVGIHQRDGKYFVNETMYR